MHLAHGIWDREHTATGERWSFSMAARGERTIKFEGEPDWPKRGMQFTDLATGDLNLQRYAELMMHIGYPQRYMKLMGTKSAPLVVEAESAHKDLDFTSANGIAYVRDQYCWPAAAG
jgi:hypothetical protein